MLVCISVACRTITYLFVQCVTDTVAYIRENVWCVTQLESLTGVVSKGNG